METQLLATFATVARLGSFSAAAERLGYTQAAISQQIAALESELKTRLLTRRPVAPTEAGERLMEHVEPLLLRLDAARADVARLSQAPAASLAVATTPIAATGAELAQALATLQRRMPRVRISVHGGDVPAVTSAVARGDDDLGLVHGLAAPGDPLTLTGPLTGIGVAEHAVAVVLPEDHPLARQPGLRLQSLVDARWIEARGAALPLHDVRRAAGTDGFRPGVAYDGTAAEILLALVAAGHGIALLPRIAMLTAFPGVAFVPVTDPPIAYRTEIVHGTTRPGSPAAELAGLLGAGS